MRRWKTETYINWVLGSIPVLAKGQFPLPIPTLKPISILIPILKFENKFKTDGLSN